MSATVPVTWILESSAASWAIFGGGVRPTMARVVSGRCRRISGRMSQAETVSPAAGAEAALWGAGADGWKFSRLVGGSWSGRMHDEHDRRRDQRGGVAAGRGRDDLGGGQYVAGVD